MPIAIGSPEAFDLPRPQPTTDPKATIAIATAARRRRARGMIRCSGFIRTSGLVTRSVALGHVGDDARERPVIDRERRTGGDGGSDAHPGHVDRTDVEAALRAEGAPRAVRHR